MQQQVAQEIRNGSFDLTAIATKLNTSPRTIQRLLMCEGIEFRNILAQTRIDMTKSYIKQHIPGKAIAKMLGFANDSAFYRFFRRMIKCSFRQYVKDITFYPPHPSV